MTKNDVLVDDAINILEDVRSILEFMITTSNLDNINNPFVNMVQVVLPGQVDILGDVISSLRKRENIRQDKVQEDKAPLQRSSKIIYH